jgi:hypothetical protein
MNQALYAHMNNKRKMKKKKKIVIVKLIIQKRKEKTRYSKNKKFSLFCKSSGLILLLSNPGIGTWYFGLCGEGYSPFRKTAWGGDGWWVFSFLFF